MNKTIVEIFEKIVITNSKEIALRYKEQSITYEDLNYRVNSLSSYLLDNYYISSDTIISVFLEKSDYMIVAILAILKSGAAYLPIDSSYPKDRIEYMLKDSKSKLILTDKINLKLAKKYSNNLNIEFLSIENIKNKKEHNINKNIRVSDLAYLIYTSGTTGKPKGVMVEHGGFVNMIRYQIESFNITKNENVIQFASFSFDASVYETFLALLAGATYVIVKKDELLENFLEICKKYSINVAVLNPSFLANVGELENFKTIITAGEKAIVEDAIKYSKICNYINAYGPTETSICSSFYKVNPNKKYNSIPIGKDIINSKIYILDDNLEEVSKNSIGEIYTAGVGLARGYIGKDDLTKEKFIEHHKFGRIYKSGDLAKFLKDGNIEYIGRVDDQVKIRGHRIELGEIENNILKYPSIKEVIVLEKDKTLIAYFKGKKKNLKEYLKKRLPEYMVPSYFIKVKEFILTPNGKIDKKILLNIKNKSFKNKKIILPKTDNEKKLYEIFKDVLNLTTLSIDEDFFNLGGDSLMAMSIIAKIKSQFKIQITIKKIYKHSSIKSLASLIKLESKVNILDIKSTPINKYYSISSSQKQLWILDKMQKNLIAYNLPIIIKVDNIDIKVLKNSIYKLVQRHQILRTNFIEIDTQVQQIIKDISIVNIFEEVNNINNVNNFIEMEAKKVFNLETDSLFYTKLINNNYLFINMHHIISDAWSMGVITEELSNIYNSLFNNEEIVLKPLNIQYKDYSVWQNNLLKDNNFINKNHKFWHKFLKDYKRLDFPLDFPRKNIQTFDGKKLSIKFNKELSLKLNLLSKNHTLFSTLITITNILLSKYSNQNDIIVGIPVANRESQELFNQVGFYVNTLPFRVKLDSNLSFKKLLSNIQNKTFDIFNYQNYPFDRLVDEIENEKDLSQNPLFNIMIVLQNNQKMDNKFSNYKSIDINSSKFDITFEYIIVNDNIELSLEYNSNLFKASTINRIALNLEQLIKTIDFNSKLSNIDIISNKEKKLLKSFNKSKANYPNKDTLISLMENQVKINPNKIITIFEDTKLTYKELNDKANRVSHFLVKKGILLDDIVAIKIDRSLEMIIGLFGILKAGAAYLPLDMEYPQERIDYIISDAKCKVLLLKKDILDKNLEKYSNKNLNLKIKPNNLAYVIYTSGSTGKPKGVMLEHQGVVNRLDWMQKEYNLNKNDIILHKTPYSFDVSVWELFLPIIFGIKQVISKPDGHKDNIYLLELIKKEKITFLHFVPSMLKAIIDTKGLEDCISIKNIVCSGEALPFEIVKDFYSSINHISLHNLYGPTEASIDVTSFSCPKENSLNIIPIGKRINNIKIYILDNNLKEVAIGVIGELYIQGVGLARGYLNQKELTDEKFINHPIFGRVYKSGDYARYLEDGNIEYIGRVDDQIKLRGFRIELGEIENSILEYPTIKNAVVLVKNKELVAYIIGEENNLREFLSRKLTSYMVPNHIIKMDSFPLTPNGKLDKKSFLAPKNIDRDNELVLPSTDNEKILLEIFRDILKIKDISINDNFFFIGGDSIKAIQIISKLNSLGFTLEIKDIFYNPTISGLGKILNFESIEIINQSKVTGEFNLIPIQKFFIENFDNINHFNQYLILESKIDIDFNKLKEAFNIIIEHHDVLRSRFKLKNKEYIQIIEEDSNFELEYIPSKENINNIIKEVNSSFHINETPLIKAILFGNDTLFITIHHLIMDGIGLRILVEGIEKAYQGIALAHKTISYKDWSNGIYNYANSDKIDKSYWNNKQYKVFDKKIESKVANKNQLKFTLDKSLINQDYKISSILLLAFSKVLFNRTKKDKFSIVMEGHGREDILGLNISRTIGWFTTLFLTNIEYREANITTQLESIENSIELLHNGFDYGILKYISKENLNFEPEISFNYLGEINLESDELFKIKDLALSSSYKNERIAPIEIESLILNELIVYIAFDNTLITLFSDFDIEFKKELISIMDDLNKNKIYSLTYAQKGLFLMDNLNNNLKVYNETACFSFNKNLNIDILKKSFLALINKHEILRTAFLVLDGIPKQQVLDKIDFDVEVEYLNNNNLNDIIKEFDSNLFNLNKPPLFRAKLLKLKSKEYILLITFHHIIIDGWSLNVILDDLKNFYNAFVTNKDINLNPLKIQYKDFVLFSHNLLKKSEDDKQFWLDKLSDIKVSPYIPYDFNKSKSYEGGLIRVKFDSKISTNIRDIVTKSNKTLFSFLITTIDILFHLYSNEENIILGTPVANGRDNNIFENQIGIYLNTLVLKSTIDVKKSFKDIFHTINEDILDTFNHQNYPYDKIIEDLKTKDALFNVMVILQNFEKKEFNFENLDFNILENINYGSKFDIKFEFEDKDEIELMIEYSTDIYKKETIALMANNLIDLIELITNNSDLKLDYLEKELKLNQDILLDFNEDIDEDF